MITIIAGKRDAGKTNYLKKLIENQEHLYGYISEKIIEDGEAVGYTVQNIVTGIERPLVHQNLRFEKTFANKRFQFDLKGFETCCEDLIEASESYKDIVIDEIGMLEMNENLGFYHALEVLIKKEVNLYLSVRDMLLPQLVLWLERYKKQYKIIPLKTVGAIIMASGAGSRFKLGNKLLYPYKGEALFEITLKNTLRSQCFSKVVVVSRYEGIQKICEKYKQVEYIHNDYAEEGISSSIKLGTAYLSHQVDGYMYIQADQIFIKPATFKKLVEHFKNYEVEVVVPKFGEKLASPKIMSAILTEKLLRLTGDDGGKAVVRACSNTLEVQIEDESEIIDIDTIEDLNK